MTRPAPLLLNDDGNASIATAVMLSHQALRRDIARFARALEKLDASRSEALKKEWQNYRSTLHGHHEAEDMRLFPHLAAQHASLAPLIERLAADHRRIDPLLERSDRAFAALPEVQEAAAVVKELGRLLDEHLELEEAEVISYLRDAREFPPPPTDADAELFAQGFAWSMQGVHPDVIERVCAMLPEPLISRLPAARAAFDARCEQAWGPMKAGATRTSLPDP